MITKIEIKNFKSIQHTIVRLNPLTVIVGANSTGKSNLIKALDFLSDLTEYGVSEAVYNRGGLNELLPKQFSSLRGLEIYFKVTLQLDPPKDWPENYGVLEAEYEIGLKKNRTGDLVINQESIEIKSILLVSHFLNKEDLKTRVEFNDELVTKYKESWFKLYRNSLSKEIKFSTSLDLADEINFELLTEWLGLKSFFKNRNYNITQFKKFLHSLFNDSRPNSSDLLIPIISFERPILTFSPHLRSILNDLESISRYDLFINELRKEQAISNLNTVSTTGDNVPSVVKTFIRENQDAWKRITTTMSNISPYFSKVYSDSLKAGKEYIVFEEIFKGRSIESWDASDGTLRALAILLCLESHTEQSTILIEEPEHGLHPWAIKDLLSHIRETIELNKIQVVLTTHSQQVLECIFPNEILITERDQNGTHYNIIPENLKEKISMGEIGQLWTKGLLKGVPVSF